MMKTCKTFTGFGIGCEWRSAPVVLVAEENNKPFSWHSNQILIFFFLHTNYTLFRWREDESDLMLSENKSSDEMPLSNIAFLCLPFSPVCKLQSTVMGAEPPE